MAWLCSRTLEVYIVILLLGLVINSTGIVSHHWYLNTMDSARSYGPHSMVTCTTVWPCCWALSWSGRPAKLAAFFVIHDMGLSSIPRCEYAASKPKGAYQALCFLLNGGVGDAIICLLLWRECPWHIPDHWPLKTSLICEAPASSVCSCTLFNACVSLRLPIYSSFLAHLTQLAHVFNVVDQCDVLQDV